MTLSSPEVVSRNVAWDLQADVAGSFADEAGLVAGLRAGKPEAFTTLHAGYAAPIYNLALRIVEDPHEAQDVAQEVLIKVLKGLPQDESELKLPAWLYRVTVNAAFDHVRTRKRRPLAVIDGALPEPPAVVDEFERAELGQRVDSALKELPKRQQVALVLRDVHGLSVGETASVLGLTKGSADVLLSRARASFRKIYLAGTAALGRCSEADRILAGGVGGGVSAADCALLKEHARTCPDCRNTVGLWGVAPVGLGLLLPQVALPADLSLGATLAAAQAAGVAVPAGLGVAATGSAAAGAGGSAASASATALTGAAAPAAAAAGGGVLAALGSAAGVKVATLAVVAAAAVGVAGIATHAGTDPGGSLAGAERVVRAGAVAPATGAGAGLGAGERAHARMLAGAYHDGVGAAGDRRGTAAGAGQAGGGTGSNGSAVQRSGGDASQVKAQGGQATGATGAGSAGGGGTGAANGATAGGTSASGSGGGGSTGGTPSSGAGGGSTGGSPENGSGGSGGGGQSAGE